MTILYCYEGSILNNFRLSYNIKGIFQELFLDQKDSIITKLNFRNAPSDS